MRNLKTIMIPVAILVFGVGSAFATNKAKTEKKASIFAYHFDPAAPAEKCIPFGEIDCDVIGGTVCTELVNGSPKVMQSYLSDTECGQTLYRN
ncbi:hypothetical protein HIO71_13835 [Chryseobacterium aquaticum]|jgi:hypothetical protein|uniref:Uncharacterized protein n=3 Tax=Chryseobacterium TaxID=59732 RepID=A0A848N713_9FLAO|nr:MULTISPECIES: DUF6520 family protein [Chryseobacterium]MDV3993861.1 hypothetical protein [Elizabethkingia anophelis]AZA79651.1 hypothetical protein EG347_20265 [Chryseobacterium sp. G0186]AZB35697.1 hypothetical protein EG351_20320 [Chryseobacterium bernardetii]EFK35954.1 hypothetical protein HMPREF0204_15023 [Chryseobacterium gleum ATCC 35910]NMR35264.1 hypothetical protein [Chryseobacterium aquaticum]